MRCTNCSNEIEDGASFCTFCGVRIKPVEEPSGEGGELGEAASAAGDEARSTTSIGAIVAALIAIIAVLCIVVFVAFNGSLPSEEDQQAVGVGEEESEAPTFESECFQIFLPEDIADVVSFTEKNNTVSIEYAPSGVVVATLFPQGEALVAEAAKRSYDLGEVYLSGHYEEALLKCVYIDADGKTTHWGSKQPRELAVEELLGISCEDLIGCIYLNTGSEFVEAHADLSADDGPIGAEEGSSDTSVMAEGSDAVPTEPFWGIWVGASKNEAEMTALAQRLKDEGVSNGVVIKTTDWSNLNPEPWWVVSAGAYASEEAANSALSDIKQRGYSNAYVKHTGSKR